MISDIEGRAVVFTFTHRLRSWDCCANRCHVEDLLSYVRRYASFHNGGELPMDLGKIRIWAMLEVMTHRETLDFANTIEKHGYQALWMPEGPGRDPGSRCDQGSRDSSPTHELLCDALAELQKQAESARLAGCEFRQPM